MPQRSSIPCTLLSLLLLAGAAEAQDESPFLAFAEDFAVLGPPPWLTEGLRFTYESMVAGPDAELGGGTGLLQADVVAVTPRDVALAVRMFGQASPGGPWLMLGETSTTGLPAWGDDTWVHPAVLATLTERLGRGSGFEVDEGGYEWGGEEVAAVHIRSGGGARDDLRSEWVYDGETGILLHHLCSMRAYRGTGWEPVQRQDLVSFRALELPWALGRPPSWIFAIRRYVFGGEVLVQQPGSWPNRTAVRSVLEVEGSGANWIRFRETVRFPGAGDAPVDETVRVSGPTQVGGLWISPPGLTGLRAGQLLDTDPVTGVKLLVEAVGRSEYGREVVRLREEGPLHAVRYDYEIATGMLLAVQAINEPLSMQVTSHFIAKRR